MESSTSIHYDVRRIIFNKLSRRVVAIEPDPGNALILRRRFRFRKRVTILEAAVGQFSGRSQMTVGAGAYSTLSKKQRDLFLANERYSHLKSECFENVDVAVVSLDNLITRFGRPDYIKIDVEGYETSVLAGLSEPICLISFEANLPDFEMETIDCIERLAQISKGSVFNFTISDPPKLFASKSWLSHGEMIAVVKSRAFEYMEIFSKSMNRKT